MVLIGGIGTNFKGSNKILFVLGAIFASVIWFFSIAYFGKFLKPFLEHNNIRKIFDILIGLIMWAITLSLLKSN